MASARAKITHPNEVSLDLKSSRGKAEAEKYQADAAAAERNASAGLVDARSREEATEREFGRESEAYRSACEAFDDLRLYGLGASKCRRAWDKELHVERKQ